MKKWTKNDEQYLKNNYNILTNAELCNYFKISKGTFTKKARELGLKRKAKWSKNKEHTHKLQFSLFCTMLQA